MIQSGSIEKLSVTIASLSKMEIKRRLLGFRGKPRLDFTEDYLDRLSIDKLRHILFAAMVTGNRN